MGQKISNHGGGKNHKLNYMKVQNLCLLKDTI